MMGSRLAAACRLCGGWDLPRKRHEEHLGVMKMFFIFFFSLPYLKFS